MALHTPPFEADSVPATQGQIASAVSFSTAFARYEIESGRGNAGTKILMIEWGDEDDSDVQGDWEVSWEGKSTVLSAKDVAEDKLHRLYFLLPPASNVPRIVTLSQAGGRTMQTNPLPAIFPTELGITARAAGRKGVLHTIWAKKRLQVLGQEIDAEMKTNGEGVGLEMALQEKQWIEDHFGVGSKSVVDPQLSPSPGSPKTPGGGSGRLSEKLKGLRLETNSPASSQDAHPLSPDTSDIAVSSFSAFHGSSARPVRAVAQNPPDHIIAQQGGLGDNRRMNSLDAITGGEVPEKVDEVEEGLFAVRMSPRSPDMTQSPFSFTADDTAPWLKNNE
ncbi:hypothetical protein BP5796_08003 [Coleophoma crateriformis]|uniref:Uncharacterized protein n=1 Tax=Coleophoma crateriformis TaxID=565419 RepID=A0A3D8RD41_9HELO|nr:hypothetical protein BP5796_08003 [Coleophoma crateriformis]